MSLMISLVVTAPSGTATSRELAGFRRALGRADGPFELIVAESVDEGIQRAHGEWIAVIDVKDRVSKDFFRTAVSRLSQTVTPAVAHPAVVRYRQPSETWRVRSSLDPSLTLADVIGLDQWPSATVAHRRVFEQHPLPVGQPYVSAAWHLQTLASGIDHLPAPGTLKGQTRQETRAAPLLSRVNLERLRATFKVRVSSPSQPVRSTRIGRGLKRRAAAARAHLDSRLPLLSSLLPKMRPTHDDGFGTVLLDIIEEIQGRAILVTEALTHGDAGLPVTSLLRGLAIERATAGGTAVLSTSGIVDSALVPEGVISRVLAQEMHHPALAEDHWNRLVAQSLLWAQPAFVVNAASPQLDSALAAYPDLSDRVNIMTVDLSKPHPVLDHTVEVVNTAGEVVRWPSPEGLETTPMLRTYTAAYHDRDFDMDHPFRLLVSPNTPRPLLDAIAASADSSAVPIKTYEPGEPWFIERLDTTDYHSILVDGRTAGAQTEIARARLLGLPVIACSGTVGLANLTDGVDGLVVPSHEPAALLQAISHLAAHRALRREIVHAGRRRSFATHSWEGYREDLRARIRKLVADGAPSA